MKINDIIYFDDKYEEAVDFCNDNNLMIIEIEANEKGRRFQIVEPQQPTKEEIKRNRISELKELLKSTDYQAIKYAEGLISESEYIEVRVKRQTWRNEINQLEQELEQ